ncbi:MAG TPA: hypothetical protein VFR27_17495 [Mycobacterium sp.]|nr:hypothetical protein [Mycobacterium sp.]
MDIVLGVSMAPSTVRMVLVEGQNADGLTVDHDVFNVEGGNGHVPDRVLAAIVGTRESAREGGYQLSSTGVTWTDQAEATQLRTALMNHKIENVMLVSAFLAAAALAQAVGNLTNYARTGLLFIEPDTATLAVVNSADGSIAEVHRQALPADDDRAVAELAEMVAGVDRLPSNPDGVFVVGSGVNVAMIKPELDKASPVPVSAPEEPEMALARGAALASANAPLFSSSTQAVAWAQDPGTGAVDPALAALAYAQVPAPVDYDATADHDALAYSAVPDDPASGYLPAPADSGRIDFGTAAEQQEHKPFMVTGSALGTVFVVGVVALVISLAVGIRSTHTPRPDIRSNVVVPTRSAPPPPTANVPAPAPQQQPAPRSAEPEVPAPAPVPQAPAPAPPPPPGLPPLFPQLPLPGLPGGPGPGPPGPWGRGGGDWGHGEGDWGHGEGGGHGHGRGGGGILIPLPIPGLRF